jgi:hypothetical protein
MYMHHTAVQTITTVKSGEMATEGNSKMKEEAVV